MQWEWYELIGDVTTNKIVVWYYANRFKDLFNPQTALGQGNLSPVAIMARLKMNSISKRAYSRFARHVQFDRWIRMPVECESDSDSSVQPPRVLMSPEADKPDSACEDVFESFVGCLEYLCDQLIGPHVGYAVCYEWMRTVLDECIQHVDFSLEALYDSVSICNERKSIAGSQMDCRIETHILSPRLNSHSQSQYRPPGKTQYKARYVVLVKRPGSTHTIEVPHPWSIAQGKREACQTAAKAMLDNKCFEAVVDKYGLTLRQPKPAHSSISSASASASASSRSNLATSCSK
jgi:hypothetical protein